MMDPLEKSHFNPISSEMYVVVLLSYLKAIVAPPSSSLTGQRRFSSSHLRILQLHFSLVSQHLHTPGLDKGLVGFFQALSEFSV